ncbi:MAG: alpha/beta hydrolase [Pseudomonadota bacterium]
MYVITNREIHRGRQGLAQFGRRPNENGANELRVAEVSKNGRSWKVRVLADKLAASTAARLIKKHKLPLDPKAQHYASLRVACDVIEKARREKKHILFFVHGYNNDMKDALTRALDFEARYGVVCITFSWPSNGGGAISGTASYKSDKRDARASAGALERALMIMHKYLQIMTEANRRRLFTLACKGNENNAIRRDERYAELLQKDCPFTVNAIYHSMGNYLLKQSLKSTITEGNGLIFDNVVLAAADTNNQDHQHWVEKIAFRNRCFIAINEKDFALGASRAKAGPSQRARLGHYLKNLTATNAHYVNFTGVDEVGNSHGYFGGPSEKNPEIFAFFKAAFDGEAAEQQLTFNAAGNWYDF